MVELGRDFQQLQLDLAAERGKQMVGLGTHRPGRRLFERRILLEGFIEKRRKTPTF
jgi:hypothetical protein